MKRLLGESNGGRNLESDRLKTFDKDADQAKVCNDQYDCTLIKELN